MKKLVILGGGTAGTMMVNKLAPVMERYDLQITLIDQEETHYYQPGFLFIPFGIYGENDVIKPKRDFIPPGVEMIVSEIELIEPAVILALGRVAAHKLLNTEQSLASLRNRQHDYAGIPLIVSYHPAYLLRKPVEKRKSWQDLKRVRTMINSHGSLS